MEESARPLAAREITAALEWWRDAGVDLDYVDEPSGWLAAESQEQAAAAAALPAHYRSATPRIPAEDIATAPGPIGGDPSAWPTDLAGFSRWWLEEPSLDDGQVRGRIPPRGPAHAPLMIVATQPGPEDREVLFEGSAGAFLETLLGAMGLAGDAVYLASALPRHTPGANWPALVARGLGAVLARHVSLVAPQRILVLGSSALPLFGHDPAQFAKTSLCFNHEGRTIPLLAAPDLAAMADRPARKAMFWQRWLDFTGSGSTGLGG